MSDFSDRLKKARIASGYSVKEAIEAFHTYGVEISEKTLYGWERGIRTPDADVFLSLCRAYQIDSISAFLNGESSQPSAPEMVRKYDALDEHGQRLVSMVLDEEFSRMHSVAQIADARRTGSDDGKGQKTRRRMVSFWVSEQSAAAGTGTYLGGDAFIRREIPEDFLPTGASFGVPVSGNSMEPKYFDGDLLLINKQQMPNIGEIGVFLLDGSGYVKQRGKSELISLNKQYPPIPMSEGTRCFGKVVGVIRAKDLE